MKKKKIKCQCCGVKFSTENPMSAICPNCDWEQDFVYNVDDISYANRDLTIRQARQNMINFGSIYSYN